LDLYGVANEHHPWSTFDDAGLLTPINPLLRVPAPVLDAGEALFDSFVILDWLGRTRGSRTRIDRLGQAGAAGCAKCLRAGHGTGR